MCIERLPTHSPIDDLLNGGFEHGAITNIYGPAGSGKTNIALLAVLNCIKNGKKVIYIDTEGSFSLERFKQIGGNNEELKNIIVYEPSSWVEQHKRIKELQELVKSEDVGLIVVDSLVSLYRLEIDNENFQEINRQLATQYSILSKIARKYNIPVLVTNQVYTKFDEDIVEPTSNFIAKFWSKTLIELQKTDRPNHRIATLKKHRSLPEEKKVEFEIFAKGIKKVGLF